MTRTGGDAPRPRFLEVTARSLRLRCPRCGEGVIFRSWLELNENCPACGLRIRHEQGFFIGSIYLNYGITAGLVMVVYWMMRKHAEIELWQMIAILAAIGAAIPLAVTRWTRSLWLGWDYYLGPERLR